MTTNSRLTTWKRNSHLQRNYSRWSPWILYFHATRARNPSLKLTLCIAATHLTKTRLSRQNSGRNLHHASPRKDVRTNLMFALLKNPVWNFISRSVPRNRRTERAPCLFCARLSIQSQYWKRPPHGKLTHAQLLCMENEGSHTDLRSDWTSYWHVLMGPMTPTSTPESSSSFRDLFCQQTQGTWARKDKMQYIHDYNATLLHYLVCSKENVQMTWYNINWTCYACVWE